MTRKQRTFIQNRRRFLLHSFMGLGAFVGNSLLLPKITKASPLSLGSIGDLQTHDSNGVRLPEGFSSRVIARTGHDYFGYIWHAAPDGGATFATDDGGWNGGRRLQRMVDIQSPGAVWVGVALYVRGRQLL